MEKLRRKKRELGLDTDDTEGSSPVPKKSKYLKGSRTWCSVPVTKVITVHMHDPTTWTSEALILALMPAFVNALWVVLFCILFVLEPRL